MLVTMHLLIATLLCLATLLLLAWSASTQAVRRRAPVRRRDDRAPR